MGLYVKGAKKPTECRNCIFIEPSLKIGKEWRHRCFLTLKFIEDSECPLIEIPTPHGRLIDADALFQDLIEHNIPFNNDINSAINVAPTILEAEE